MKIIEIENDTYIVAQHIVSIQEIDRSFAGDEPIFYIRIHTLDSKNMTLKYTSKTIRDENLKSLLEQLQAF